MGRLCLDDKLLLRRGTHPWCYEDDYNLAVPQNCGEANGYENKAREATK
ncbi:MAG: hypothetical protein MJZ24_11290 [Paludibacteraceae bacterium]|nr:hypothetical protein [Paludibacteraceae bacterium]